MKNKKNNGFTLVELLAVIIILGLLAVITVPKINKTLKESRKSISDASAVGLERTAENYYLSKKINGGFTGCTYDFTNDINSCSGFEFTGKKPESGILEIDKNGNISYEIYINKFYYQKIILTSTKGIREENVQYYTGGEGDILDNLTYFDPINGIKKCDNYHVDNSIVGFNGVTGQNGTSTTENQTSCLKWYIYSIDDNGTETQDDDTVNLILDHNTTSEIQWNSSSERTNYDGPSSDFLAKLTTDTSGWVSDKIISPSPFTASWDTNNNYTITYTTKARLIEADEVARILSNMSWSYTTNDSEIIIQNSLFGRNMEEQGNINRGFWTSSPRLGDPLRAWIVGDKGDLRYRGVSMNDIGIRPVITVKLIDLF